MNTVQSNDLRSAWPSGEAAFGSEVVDPAPSDYIVSTAFTFGPDVVDSAPGDYIVSATFHHVLPHQEQEASKPQAHCE